MQQKYFFFLAFLIAASSSIAQSGDREFYINKYKKIAIREMERTGIPASIKLAQGILESGAGSSTLARKANNHFGIKCHKEWNGKTYYLEDDDYDDNGRLVKSCFRVYKNAEYSYIAHSEFLRDPNKRYRYGRLFLLDPLDYEAWARGLKSAGYATSPTYANNLIRIIETYRLFRFDSEASFIDVPESRRQIAGIRSNNDVKFVLANGTENVDSIALRTDTKIRCIIKFNEGIKNSGDQPQEDARVYLQRKRNAYRGKQKWHYVKEGETMYSIAQLYGVKLKKLYKRNRLAEGQEPAIGERVKIRGWKVSNSKRPTLQSERYQPPVENSPGRDVVRVEPTTGSDEEFDDFFEPEFTGTNGGFIPPAEPPVLPEPPIIIDPPTPAPPVTTQPKPPVPPTTTQPEPGLEVIYHTVIRGDTLYNISRRNGISVDRIMRLNGLDSNLISIGQQLRIQ